MGNSGWKRLKPVIIFIQLVVSMASFVTNWLLFIDVNNVLPGLVFGPFSSEFRHTVLAFCIISSILNILEIWFLWTELFRRHSNCYMSGNTSSALIIWLDDIPKAIFMLIITSCHDRTISIVEVARSSLLLITALIRIIAFTARECYRKRRESQGLPTREDLMKRNRPCRCCIYGAITLGIFLKILAFALLFAFNNLTTQEGRVTFKHPRGILNAKPNVEKYAQNVSIFAQVRNQNETWGWFPLVPLVDMTFLKSCTTKLSLMVKKSRIETRCGVNYKFSRDISKSPIKAAGKEVEISHSFRFIEPSSRLLLGNVEYMSLPTKGLPSGASVDLKYFCTGKQSGKDAIGFIVGLIPKAEYEYKPGQVYGSKDLITEVTYCWKTGKFQCEMQGMKGPKKVSAFSQSQ